MRKLAVVLVMIAVVVIAACGSSKKSAVPASMVTGTYLYSGSAYAPNTCVLTSASLFDGNTQDVTVTGATGTFDYFQDPLYFSTAGSAAGTIAIDITGSTFAAPTSIYTTDWTTTASQIASGVFPLSKGYNCVEADTFDLSGTITGANIFTKTTEVKFAMVSGTASQCLAAANSAGNYGLIVIGAFPCDTILTQTGTKQ